MNLKIGKWLSRRSLIGFGALVVMLVAILRGGVANFGSSRGDMVLQPMDDPAGYQMLQSGVVTVTGVPLFGLENQKSVGLVAAEKRVDRDLEAALFGPDAPGSGDIRIAYFFDYQCAICRQITPRLRALRGVTISWHDLAGLGTASQTAARAAIAARNQGAYDKFHDRLMRARFQANDGYVFSLAQSTGIDADRLLVDMQSEGVRDRMWTSRALANRFGFIGTPGLVIGRSVIVGDIKSRELRRIIESERRRVSR